MLYINGLPPTDMAKIVRSHRTTPSPPLAQLGAALQAMRKRKGLTQGELAERTGGNQAHISVIERGAFDFRASTLIAIAAALGCEVLLVPKERAAEALRSAGVTGRSASPPTVLEEVYIPDPEPEDGDAG